MSEPHRTKLYLTRKQLASRLGFHPKTVSRWVKREKIPHLLVCNKYLLFDWEMLEKSMQKRQKPDTPGVQPPAPKRKPRKRKNISSPKPKKPSRKRNNNKPKNNGDEPNDPKST